MRRGYSPKQRLDSLPTDRVPLNLERRDCIIPVLRALQQVYSKADTMAAVMKIIKHDINADTRSDYGRTGMDYWHLMVLAGVRLGCKRRPDAASQFVDCVSAQVLQCKKLPASAFVLHTRGRSV